MQENTLPVDPEEETEKKLINTMALAIVALIVGGALILALRPWMQQLREQDAETGAVEAPAPES